jgi:hypothetical protein
LSAVPGRPVLASSLMCFQIDNRRRFFTLCKMCKSPYGFKTEDGKRSKRRMERQKWRMEKPFLMRVGVDRAYRLDLYSSARSSRKACSGLRRYFRHPQHPKTPPRGSYASFSLHTKNRTPMQHRDRRELNLILFSHQLESGRRILPRRAPQLRHEFSRRQPRQNRL